MPNTVLFFCYYIFTLTVTVTIVSLHWIFYRFTLKKKEIDRKDKCRLEDYRVTHTHETNADVSGLVVFLLYQ